MSLESVTQFFQQEGQDPTLQESLQSASDRETVVNKVVELGKKKGYDFTASEVEQWLNSAVLQSQSDADGALNDEELEAVAGGLFNGLRKSFRDFLENVANPQRNPRR